MNDPIVNEIREIRNNHSKKFNYDLDAISLDYQTKHKQYIEMLAKIRKYGSAGESKMSFRNSDFLSEANL